MAAETFSPKEPESLEQTGLAESTVEHLILKILYFRGDLYGQDLSAAIGLKFSVIERMVENFKIAHLIQVKRSLGMGTVGSVLSLTESGRERARECLETNQYYGPAPVPLEQYAEMVRQQRPREGWLTKELLAHAFRNLILTKDILSQIGPAISSANSLLLYGKPGNGKTALIEALQNIDTAPIFIPYAIESQGNIVQVYDPIYHKRVEEEPTSVLAVSIERPDDRRWAKCARPFIVSGGELSIDMLDLRFNHTSRVYEAPFQMKANNGIYLIDDFGRQRATPAEVLNRWIVPMERRVDYLTFITGGKLTAPFEAFLAFSTNLNPADLGDEAFLRRIQYKMLLRGPSESEFIRIFEGFCNSRRLACTRELAQRFIDKHYKKSGKALRRCHPRDVLSHALHLITFEKLPYVLSDELLDRAFESNFLDHSDDAPAETPILPVSLPQCADYWGDKLAQITTAFGSLAYIAGFRTAAGIYQDLESERQFGGAETARVLKRLHTQAFADWRVLGFDQQTRDLARYLAATDRTAAMMQFEQREWVNLLLPSESSAEHSSVFAHDLAMALEKITPKPTQSSYERERVQVPQVMPLERSA